MGASPAKSLEKGLLTASEIGKILPAPVTAALRSVVETTGMAPILDALIQAILYFQKARKYTKHARILAESRVRILKQLEDMKQSVKVFQYIFNNMSASRTKLFQNVCLPSLLQFNASVAFVTDLLRRIEGASSDIIRSTVNPTKYVMKVTAALVDANVAFQVFQSEFSALKILMDKKGTLSAEEQAFLGYITKQCKSNKTKEAELLRPRLDVAALTKEADDDDDDMDDVAALGMAGLPGESDSDSNVSLSPR
jgi:hypothetical protein